MSVTEIEKKRARGITMDRIVVNGVDRMWSEREKRFYSWGWIALNSNSV